MQIFLVFGGFCYNVANCYGSNYPNFIFFVAKSMVKKLTPTYYFSSNNGKTNPNLRSIPKLNSFLFPQL